MNDNSKPSLNSRLRQERLLRGWSQQALADQLGTTIVTVSRWERGTQFPGPMMRLKLSMLFEKTESELGLLPELNENVSTVTPVTSAVSASQPSSQYSPDASVSTTPATESVADEAFAEVIQAEPEAISHPTQDVDSALPYIEEQATEEQASERTVLAHQSPHKHSRPWFFASRTSARWVLVLASMLILTLMTSIFLGFHGLPGASSKASGVTSSPSATTEPVPVPYGVRGHLAFDNALSNPQTGKLWYQSPPQSTGCHFLNSSYDMRDVQSNYCLASDTDYANFVYQVEMTTIQEQRGQTGRILFRADDAQHTYYDFQVGADGSYFLSRNDSTDDPVLAEGHSSAIIRGDLHPNILAVKADGKDLSLYVNFHLIAHVQDLSYTDGNIGVGINVNSGPSETEVTFRNAKVWTL